MSGLSHWISFPSSMTHNLLAMASVKSLLSLIVTAIPPLSIWFFIKLIKLLIVKLSTLVVGSSKKSNFELAIILRIKLTTH